MITEHRLTALSRCPVDTLVVDVYDVVVRCRDRIVPVERILEEVALVQALALYQEDVTQRLADRLEVEVETRGWHSGVETVCKASPA